MRLSHLTILEKHVQTKRRSGCRKQGKPSCKHIINTGESNYEKPFVHLFVQDRPEPQNCYISFL